MRVVVVDNEALEAKQSYFFSQRVPVATGLLIGRVSVISLPGSAPNAFNITLHECSDR